MIYNRERLREAKWKPQPFNHVVLDNLWDADTLRILAKEFPEPLARGWVGYDNPEERGKYAGGPDLWTDAHRAFFSVVRSETFLMDLEHSVGIHDMTPDDIGGGLHMTGPGGRLNMHIDFNFHPNLPLKRRLNLLVFLNEEWSRSWGGTLYLGQDRKIEVLPILNRTVIFECSETSYHGHPDPIVGEHYRKSLACYYYTPIEPADKTPAHTTVWTD